MLLNLDVATPGRREVWRHCESCDDLAAMPAYVLVCDTCAAAASGAVLSVDLASGDGDE